MSTTIKTPMIIKVQRPIATASPSNPWLVYTKGRRWMRKIPEVSVPKKVIEQMGEDMKAYFNAELTTTELHIRDRIEAQDW